MASQTSRIKGVIIMNRVKTLYEGHSSKKELSTKRPLSVKDIELFCKLAKDNPHKRVRVYSDWGFVPNSYKYRCDIEYIERYKGKITSGLTGAQRPRGDGPHAVVGNRRV